MNSRALGLSLLAALLLHLAAAALWQALRRGPVASARLGASDDTPLLLQFSRQETMADALLAVPLPAATQLPPPPPGPLATAPAARTTAAAAPRRPGGSTTPRKPAAAARSTGAESRPPRLEPGSPARLALETALQEAAGGDGTGSQSAEPGSGAVTPVRGRLDGTVGRGGGAGGAGEEGLSVAEPTPSAASGAGEQGSSAAADRRLWSLARPMPLPKARTEDLPPGFALRRLPLDLARRSGARPVHLGRTRSGERLVLFWIEADTLWLLGAPVAATPG